MKKFLKTIVTIAIIGAFGYYFRAPLSNILARLENQFLPCYQPIGYSLGTFDTRFGISKTDFLAAVAQAEAIWEKPAGKDLFKAAADGSLKINLIYDSRQAATATLKDLGITVDANRASYDSLKAQYETQLADFKRDQAAYSAEVAAVNARGGAKKDEFDRLTAEGASLNSRVNTINAMATALNDLAAKLNISVDKFNQVGAARGEEFNEGLYVSDASGASIDIYEYSSRAKLIRVLAHELGHALGLDHVADPQAIMYRLNQASAEKLTADDLSALKTRCRLE